MSNSGGAPTPTPAPSQTPASSAPTGGRFNGRNNRRRNRNHDSSNNGSNKFVPKLSTIESLVSSSENKGQDFTKFQKAIHHHGLTAFKNSKDISKAILKFVDPHAVLRQSKPNLTTIRTKNNLHPDTPVAKEDERKKFQRESENADE